jgi:HPt (histidine-containing phosphotransfer) domain-containing protein
MNETILIKVDADLADLIPGFLDNRHRDVARLESLVAQGDFAEIQRIGHSMKGVGGGYGFDEISVIGADVEKAAVRGDAVVIEEACARLRDYLARIEIVFEES